MNLFKIDPGTNNYWLFFSWEVREGEGRGKKHNQFNEL
jgi:hypothetical protein